MPGHSFQLAKKLPVVQRSAARVEPHEQDECVLHHHPLEILGMQRLVGNRGIQTMLTSGQARQQGNTIQLLRAPVSVQRCGCGGACAACKGEDEPEVTADPAGQVRRFWGDDEDDSGGSWLSDAASGAADWVSDTASSAYNAVSDAAGAAADWVGDTAGSAYDAVADTAGSAAGWAGDMADKAYDTAAGAAGSAADWVSEQAGAVADWAGDTWDAVTGDSDTEAPNAEESSWLDWLPDIDFPFINDEAEEPQPVDLGEIDVEVDGDEVGAGQATCVSEEASNLGGGSSGGVSVRGLTSIDWRNTTGAGSFLNPTLKKRKSGDKTVFDVSGKVHIDYSGASANVSFTVTPPLSSLSECKQEKVNAFKGPSGALGKHEADHVAKLESFNGSEEFDHTFTGLEANSTEELTEKVNAALNALVQPRIKARQSASQKSSDDLDPWSEPIPGIASCNP